MSTFKTLEQLEKQKWDKQKLKSNLAKECKRLWSVPINEMSVENLRMLIGQHIGLRYLVPEALNILIEKPLAEGALYKGDLLSSILSIPEEFWLLNESLQMQLTEISIEVEIMQETINKQLLPTLRKITQF